MDTLTHAISGAVLARATTPNKPQHDDIPLLSRTFVGFLVAAFPDTDFILRFIDPMLYLTAHRGITHSIIMLPVWALILSFVFYWLWRKRYPWKKFFSLCVLSLGIHILGDLITSFGTMILSPVSNMRFALSTTFIIDLYFSGILLTGLVLSFLLPVRQTARISGLVLAGYISFQAILQYQALDIAKEYAKQHQLNPASVHVLPQPLSPFNWKLIVKHNDLLHIAFVNLYADEIPLQPKSDASFINTIASSYYPVKQAEWKSHERFGKTALERQFAHQVWEHDTFAKFRWFAMFPVLHRFEQNTKQACAWFADLRFELKGRQPPFIYGMCKTNYGSGNWRFDQFGK